MSYYSFTKIGNLYRLTTPGGKLFAVPFTEEEWRAHGSYVLKTLNTSGYATSYTCGNCERPWYACICGDEAFRSRMRAEWEKVREMPGVPS
jgi:hypothetical protein